MFSLFLFIVTMLVTQVCASAAIIPLGVIHGLTRRQSDSTFDPSDIPTQCKSQCASISDTLLRCQANPSVGCDCNLVDEAAFVTCLNCILSLAPSQSLVDEAQGEVDNYVAACASVGFSLPSTKVAGATPTASITRAGGASATGDAGSPFSQNTFQPAPSSGAGPGSGPADPLSQSIFQPAPTSGGGSGSNGGSNSGPLPGTKSAALRAEAGAMAMVITAIAYVILF